MAAVEATSMLIIDEAFEFSAPRFYDFINGEKEDDVRKAELWFERSLSHAPSPFMPKIKASRTVEIQPLCNFGEEQQQKQMQKIPESSSISAEESAPCPPQDKANSPLEEPISSEIEAELIAVPVEKKDVVEACWTPSQQPQKHSDDGRKKVPTAKKIASTKLSRNPSSVKLKPASVSRDKGGNKVKGVDGTPNNVAHENRAIKRQKLEGGKSRQILTVNKPLNLPHKTKTGIVTAGSSLLTSNPKTSCKEYRTIYVREQAAAENVPFVSTAEMVRKFQSQTRDLSLPSSSCCSASQNNNGAATVRTAKPKLKLTRPKTPEFETSQRARPHKAQSTDELEEKMMAEMPKFKARPVNKKIFEAPSLPPLPRSTPHLPEFKEFHLETMTRANHSAETSTVASVESDRSHHHQWKPNHLTAPKSPKLRTLLRARPPKIKTSEELEREAMEKIPQFKAKPLNRKILESKGEMGMFSNMKKPITIPQEFDFAIDKRIPPPPSSVVDMFDKLSICSESRQEKQPLPRNTAPNPFHLHTEERGAEKEKRLVEELTQKQLEEEMARIPKAHPYPYTTDYPVVPPKPEPKPCTKPEPFQLESLVRHEEEMQREMEEKRRLQMEEARMRVFKAQPVLKEDPIPVPEKVRKPLTEVQEFNLHVDHRAFDRAEFDKKVKEKEMVYKRYREDAESLQMMEEEKALKQLRRTLVPHARPVPSFNNPFLPQKSSKGATKAKSPQLRVNRRKEKKRVLLLGSATAAVSSSNAFNMR